MEKQNTGILGYLKNDGRRPSDLPLNVLRQFREFEKSVSAALDSYGDRPEHVAYGMRCFTKVEMLGMALILSDDKYPAARRCLDHIMSTFGKDAAFDDGVSLPSWVLFNFPFKRDSADTIGKEVLRQSPNLKDELSPFVEALSSSRLGLYEVIKDGRESCDLKELFTGDEIRLDQTLGGISRGRIAVLRAITLCGKHFSFGDTTEFPAEKKETLEDMVENKMSFYFFNEDRRKSYESMMRLAGPYWFSILGRDYEDDILPADYYLTYHAEPRR